MTITTILAAAILSTPLPAPDEALAGQLKSALTATGFRFDNTPNVPSYRIVFENADNRKQTVYIGANPDQFNARVLYRLETIVWAGPAAPDHALLQKVVTQTKKLGHFSLVKHSDALWAIHFGAKFDATAMPTAPKATDAPVVALKDLLYLVNAVGEETDMQLNGEKDMP